MKSDLRKQQALDYHSKGRPGKIEVIPTKDAKTQRDLSLAYSPGVAEPCKEIAANKEDVYKYTAKGNLVGVISNGTAVLGLGDIGPEAGKPVMEGKGVLFKILQTSMYSTSRSMKKTLKNLSRSLNRLSLHSVVSTWKILRRLSVSILRPS